jgi:hypothetical protein
MIMNDWRLTSPIALIIQGARYFGASQATAAGQQSQMNEFADWGVAALKNTNQRKPASLLDIATKLERRILRATQLSFPAQ